MAENCIKMKEFGPTEGGGAFLAPPLDPLLICVVIVNGKKLIHYPNEISSSMDSIQFSNRNKSTYPGTVSDISLRQ